MKMKVKVPTLFFVFALVMPIRILLPCFGSGSQIVACSFLPIIVAYAVTHPTATPTPTQTPTPTPTPTRNPQTPTATPSPTPTPTRYFIARIGDRIEIGNVISWEFFGMGKNFCQNPTDEYVVVVGDMTGAPADKYILSFTQNDEEDVVEVKPEIFVDYPDADAGWLKLYLQCN